MNDKLVCKICNIECKTHSSLAYHIKMIHKIDSKIYYDLYLKKLNEGICKTCGKITRYYGLQKGYCKFCSTECSNNNPEIKKKLSISSTIYSNTKEGKEIRSKSGKKILGIKRSEKFRKNQKNRMLGHIPWNKNLKGCFSIKSLNRMSISQLRRFNETEEGLKFKENAKQRLLNGGSSYILSFIKNPSKPQVELYNIVKDLFPSAILNYSLYELNYSLDIAIPELKIWIESDGPYWHQDKEKDLQRQRKIENLGWKCIRYVADTVKDVPLKNKVFNDITEVINNDN